MASDNTHQPMSGTKRKGAPASSPSSSEEDDDESRSEVERLNWTEQPDECFLSDYRIEIRVRGSEQVATCYSVHRSVLSVGAKTSGYFVRIFQNENFAESRTKVSYIELHELAARAFPAMLDYLYSPSDALDIAHDNAAALHHLGQYFGIASLRKRARQFWKDSMTIAQCGTYYGHAKIFQDDKLVQAVVKKCCQDFDDIETDSHLFAVSDVHLWLEILKENAGLPDVFLCSLIASFCLDRQNEMDAETFTKLTREELLPVVGSEAALHLLKLEKIFYLLHDTNTLSALQERCVEALAKSWKDSDSSKVAKFLAEEVNPLVMSQVLMLTTERAKNELQEAERKFNGLRGVLPKEIVVAGAGIAAVNGVYGRTRFFNNAPVYALQAAWNDEPTRFEIFLQHADGASDLFWWISSGTNCFYGVCHVGQDVVLPPGSGWFWTGDGINPSPTLTFRYDNA